MSPSVGSQTRNWRPAGLPEVQKPLVEQAEEGPPQTRQGGPSQRASKGVEHTKAQSRDGFLTI